MGRGGGVVRRRRFDRERKDREGCVIDEPRRRSVLFCQGAVAAVLRAERENAITHDQSPLSKSAAAADGR
jgi:hypothetical protein